VPELSDSKKLVLKKFYDDITTIKTEFGDKPISILLEKLIEKIEFYKYLDDGTGEGEARIQNVRELFSVAARYDGSEHSLADFLEGIALVSDLDNHDKGQESVTLMTIHASKGLEFPLVFLPGWEEGIFPSASSQFAHSQLEEERRLAYVALTRAEKKCFISHARQRMLFGKIDYSSASKFISELDDECIERTTHDTGPRDVYSRRRKAPTFNHPLMSEKSGKKPFQRGVPKVEPLRRQPRDRTEAVFGIQANETEYKSNDRVKHAEFGEGTIIQVAGDVLAVAFKDIGIKKIVASVAPINKI